MIFPSSMNEALNFVTKSTRIISRSKKTKSGKMRVGRRLIYPIRKSAFHSKR